MSLPNVVTPEQWQAAREALLEKEKAATRMLDALAAERRRLPMVAFDATYELTGPDGPVDLLGLFDGRRQLAIYHFMLQPGGEPCVGCSSLTDNVGHLDHLHARDTTFVLTSRAPIGEIEAVRRRMGWTVPWYSSAGSSFEDDCGIGGGFGLSVFLREGEDVYRTYFTTNRGSEHLRFDFNLLDLTPLGRQEEWEDSPEGWPQTPPYTWWRYRHEYA